MNNINYYAILDIGGDIRTLRTLESNADAKWRDLISACNQIEPDVDRVVRAAEDYAEAAHDCTTQRAFVTKNAARLLNDDCKGAVMQMIKGPHDAEKARSIYHALANLKARTEEEDQGSWDNVFDGAIDWLREGATIVYNTAEEVAAAKAKARATMRALVLDNTL